MTEVQIKVNASNLINNLGAVFSDSKKVLSELMQNAYRAGAKKINISEEDCVVIVSDDGGGISSFTDLLTLAQSGWDEDVMLTNSPYGMGFISTLFSSDKVTVHSNGKQITVDCKNDFLTQKIAITSSDVHIGTRVELHGCKVENIENALHVHCAGFPVDVFLNGSEKPIPSPHRLTDDFKDFGVGKIKSELSKFRGNYGYGCTQVRSYIAYLQGFVVDSNYGYNSTHSRNDVTVIHLDESFRARMPDRDCLINPEEEENRISGALVDFRKNQISEIKKADPCDLFNYYSAISDLDFIDVFNDIEVLPRSFFGMLSHPIKSSEAYQCSINPLSDRGPEKNFFTKEEVKIGGFLRGDPTGIDNSEHPYAMALMMAISRSESIILKKKLDANHWVYVNTQMIPDLSDFEYEDRNSDMPLKVTYPEPLKSGNWNGNAVLLVDHYLIEVPSIGLGVRVDLKDGLAIGCDEDGFEFVDPSIMLFPKESDSDVLDQCNTWISDDQYDESWASTEKGSLNAYLRVLRGQNPASVLSDLLADTDCIIRETLAGKTFIVAFGSSGIPSVAEAGNE